jgi:DNA-binding response OmpR family regulator
MDTGARHILIVEDDEDLRSALVLFLQRAGFAVVEAADGASALAGLRHDQVGLVLLDLQMPTMDGRRFRAEQLRDPAAAAVPVVLLSADYAVDREAASLHAVDHMTKPVDLDRLLAIVRRYC